MTEPLDVAASPQSESPRDDAREKPTIVRAGSLAGRAVVMVWGVSVLYHVVLFVAMYLLPWLADMARDGSDAPPPFTSIEGAVDQPVTSLTPSPRADSKPELTERERLEFKPKQFQSMDAMTSSPRDELRILGIGTGGGDLGERSFAMPLGGGGPDFFGLGGQARGARKIVYVVDRSGSMLNTFGGVVKELKESIGALRRTQRFHVIFFNSGAALENPPRRMVSAIQAHKRAAFQFFDTITPMGDTDPRPAMRRAFAVEPDLIYFLTDGEFDAHAESMFKMLEKMNRRRQVRIFTIAYVEQQGAAVLERMAREHNGEYRFVSEDEIF